MPPVFGLFSGDGTGFAVPPVFGLFSGEGIGLAVPPVFGLFFSEGIGLAVPPSFGLGTLLVASGFSAGLASELAAGFSTETGFGVGTGFTPLPSFGLFSGEGVGLAVPPSFGLFSGKGVGLTVLPLLGSLLGTGLALPPSFAVISTGFVALITPSAFVSAFFSALARRNSSAVGIGSTASFASEKGFRSPFLSVGSLIILCDSLLASDLAEGVVVGLFPSGFLPLKNPTTLSTKEGFLSASACASSVALRLSSSALRFAWPFLK